MKKQRIQILTPIIVIACFMIYTWYNILFTEYGATWRHYIGLVFFLLLVFLFFKNYIKAMVATGIFLLLATFNALAITVAITTSSVAFLSMSTPPVQLLSLGIFIIYFILNMDSLIEMYLDYKEAKDLKNKNSN